MSVFLRPFALCLALAVSGNPAAAFGTDDQLRTFATCVGRMSALVEFQWMFAGEMSEQTEAQRDAILDLVVAIITPDDGRAVLNWRMSAKQAQHALLNRATFNDDPSDAAWAADMANRLTSECTSLILS